MLKHGSMVVTLSDFGRCKPNPSSFCSGRCYSKNQPLDRWHFSVRKDLSLGLGGLFKGGLLHEILGYASVWKKNGLENTPRPPRFLILFSLRGSLCGVWTSCHLSFGVGCSMAGATETHPWCQLDAMWNHRDCCQDTLLQCLLDMGVVRHFSGFCFWK